MCVPQDEDAMQMVWHHDVRVQIDMREESREGSPHGFDDSTDCSQPDPTSFYLSENTCSPEGTDCDEIPPSIAVIEPPQTNRAPDGQFAHAVPLRLVLSRAKQRERADASPLHAPTCPYRPRTASAKLRMACR